MYNQHRVVITGMGAISPLGYGVKDFFDGIREGRSAVGKPTLFHDPEILSQVVAEVPNFDPAKYMKSVDLARVPRLIPMAIGAAREAFSDAGINLEALDMKEKQQLNVIVGSGAGGIEFGEQQYETFFGSNKRNLTPYCISSSFVGMLSSEISIALGLRGLSHVISTGCTSSTDAIGYAYQLIRFGAQEVILTGGADACITRGLMTGFSRMKVVSMKYNETPEKASRPFDAKRDGFVLGEGAWMFVMESYERARNRGAKIYAEVVGYGSTCDAYHRVQAPPDGMESARAMSLALENANLTKDQIQYINLHGTSTPMNDSVETNAVKLVFNGRAQKVATSATKSMIGHPQGACGAAGVMATVFALRQQFVPPTINYENPDPACDLNYTPNRGVTREMEYAMTNTIAFGSKNSALILKRWDKDCHAHSFS